MGSQFADVEIVEIFTSFFGVPQITQPAASPAKEIFE
jgi:hypothetical protein